MTTFFERALTRIEGSVYSYAYHQNYALVWWMPNFGLTVSDLDNKTHKVSHRSVYLDRVSSASYVSKHLTNYPAPSSLNLSWTFGSLTFFALIIQILTGFFLSMHYTPSISGAFDSVEHIMREVNYGYAVRYTHANGASFYFVCLYCHIFRSLYYKTFIKNGVTWQIGVVILLLSMATAFLGYVLPWGQMSFWGATVITNLFSVIPFIGQDVVHSMWGGFSVAGPTLSRFYSLHFILPLIVLWLVIVHILLLHENGSSTPNKILYGSDKVSFYGFFAIKDLFLITFCVISFVSFLVFGPNVLNHPDNYNPADAMQTPPHIVPEWYFLPFYAILRAIPNKVIGVILMAGSIIVLLLLPFKRRVFKGKATNAANFAEKLVFWLFVVDVLSLGYLGGMPIEWPFNVLSVIMCILYFILLYGIASDLRSFGIGFNVKNGMIVVKKKTATWGRTNDLERQLFGNKLAIFDFAFKSYFVLAFLLFFFGIL